MITTFNDLCRTFDLPSTSEDDKKLASLVHWCYENISTDVGYTGTTAEKYTHYLDFAKHYFNAFLPHVTEDKKLKVIQFGLLNAIQYAAQQGYDQFIMKQISDHDVALDEQNEYGMTPLHLSAVYGYDHTVNALLVKGANPRILNHQAQPPIFSALFVPMSHADDLKAKKVRIFKALMATAPETITHHDKSGNTVFHLMVVNGFFELLTSMLHENTEGAFYRNHHSHYPIHSAILNNQIVAAKYLLAIPHVAALADAQHQVALHYAARYGSKEMMEICCAATTDLNCRDGSGKTALMLATEAQNVEAIQVLIKNGCFID